jgi:hypothetical protein
MTNLGENKLFHHFQQIQSFSSFCSGPFHSKCMTWEASFHDSLNDDTMTVNLQVTQDSEDLSLESIDISSVSSLFLRY